MYSKLSRYKCFKIQLAHEGKSLGHEVQVLRQQGENVRLRLGATVCSRNGVDIEFFKADFHVSTVRPFAALKT